jgi:hypothetical protein
LHVEIEKGKKNPEKNGGNKKKGEKRERKREEKGLTLLKHLSKRDKGESAFSAIHSKMLNPYTYCRRGFLQEAMKDNSGSFTQAASGCRLSNLNSLGWSES